MPAWETAAGAGPRAVVIAKKEAVGEGAPVVRAPCVATVSDTEFIRGAAPNLLAVRPVRRSPAPVTAAAGRVPEPDS